MRAKTPILVGLAVLGLVAAVLWPLMTYVQRTKEAQRQAEAQRLADERTAAEAEARAKADAEANVKSWEWPSRPGEPSLQSVFPAPIFVRRSDAELVPAHSVLLLVNGVTTPLPKRTSTPPVYVRNFAPPEWGQTRPTGACFVDVDLDATGKVQKTRWVSGEIEVSGQVFDALNTWVFFPVIVAGDRAAARVRLPMCDY